MTKDHSVDDEEEQKRIKDAGGLIINGRVNGILNMTRAFGDFMLKKNDELSCEPYVTKVELKDDVDFILLGTDGLWFDQDR